MVLSLLKMALVICIPLVLVIGTYDLKTVNHGQRGAIRLVLCGLLVSAFARWIDSTILDALYGWDGAGIGCIPTSTRSWA